MADIFFSAPDGTVYSARAADLYLPYRWNWSVHAVLTDQPATLPSGLVSLTFHGLTMTGFILHIGQSEGLTTCLIVGGRGGLWQVPQPQYYDHQVSVSLPLNDILAAVGERLSPTSTPSILSATLPSWPRRQDQAGNLLDTLCAALNETGQTGGPVIWRVLHDGSIFFGVDAWTATTAVEDVDYTVTSAEPEWLQQELAPLTIPAIFPAQSLTDSLTQPGFSRVGRVHYEDDGSQFTARIWFLGAPGADDAVVAGIIALIRQETAGTAYHPVLWGTVVTQRSDGTLDIVMADRRLPPLTSVPILVPIPGAQLTVAGGARVQVAFAGGDPRQPAALLYASGSASRALGVDGDEVDSGTITITGISKANTLSFAYVDAFDVPSGVTVFTVPGISDDTATFQLRGKLKGTAPLKIS